MLDGGGAVVAACLKKVVSGDPTEARNGSITQTKRRLPNGKHWGPKGKEGVAEGTAKSAWLE